jgi:hypothetical protein
MVAGPTIVPRWAVEAGKHDEQAPVTPAAGEIASFRAFAVDRGAMQQFIYIQNMNCASSHSATASNGLKTSVRFCWILLAIAACTGCWEEIRYQGQAARQDPEASAIEPGAEDHADVPQPESEDPVVTLPPDAGNSTPSVLPPIETPEPDSTDESTPGPSAGDLFGDDDAGDDDAAVDDASATAPGPDSPDDNPLGDDPFAVEPQPAEPPPSPAERRTAWRAASDWALAVAVAAKGHASDRYLTYMVDAERAATTIDLALPALPAATDGEAENLEASIVEILAGAGGRQLAANIAERLDSQAGASARLAVQVHLLLLTYLPSNPEGAAAAASAISAAAWEAQLPMELWQPLVHLVEKQADFLDVRAAVFTLRDAVSKYYAQQAGY